MKILVTGAHFTPAVAVIEEFKKRPNIEIVYIGRNTTREGDTSPSIESQVLPDLGIKFIPIITGRLQKDFTLFTIPSLLKIPIGFMQALFFILGEKPDVILSFGGYVAVPLVFIGWLFSIPIIVHEQTLVSGLANKISSVFATKIALSFKNQKKLNDKIIVTGNPLRAIIIKANPSINYEIIKYAKKQRKPIILITGGNQGSHTINEAVENCIDKLAKIACVIHITGDNKFKDFEKLEKLETDSYKVFKWIDEEYGAVLSNADLVVSRAGVNTLSELAFVGKPALVIPIPYLYKDEQNQNAKFFESVGLVRILPQSKLSGYTLMENIKLMLKNIEKLTKKVKGAEKIIIPDAAKRLALETILLTK